MALRDYWTVLGLSPREFAALLGGGHSLGKMHLGRSGSGPQLHSLWLIPTAAVAINVVCGAGRALTYSCSPYG